MTTLVIPKTFAELALYWLISYARERKAASSIKRDHGILKNYLLPKFGNLEIGEFTTRDVEFWITNLVANKIMSRKSANDVLVVLNKILNDAVRWNFLAANQLSRVAKFTIGERDFLFWKLSEVRKFLGYFLEHPSPPRIFWPTVLGLYTGLRRGEIQALRWEDINERAGLITIKRSYCRVSKKFKEETKSKKIRYVPICSALEGFLRRLQQMSDSELVTPFFNSDCFRKEFIRMCHEAKVPVIRFHDLRHTFASNFLMGGGNIYDLQKILGHSTIQVTERYAHLTQDHLMGKTEVLGF
jgi:integrase